MCHNRQKLLLLQDFRRNMRLVSLQPHFVLQEVLFLVPRSPARAEAQLVDSNMINRIHVLKTSSSTFIPSAMFPQRETISAMENIFIHSVRAVEQLLMHMKNTMKSHSAQQDAFDNVRMFCSAETSMDTKHETWMPFVKTLRCYLHVITKKTLTHNFSVLCAAT